MYENDEDDMPTPTVPESFKQADTARDISPVKFFGEDPDDDDNMFDFRPVQISASIPEEEVSIVEDEDPKDSSAPESADSSQSETTPEPESSASQTTPASAEKEDGPPKVVESGTPASSSKTSAGKTTETAKA